MDTIALAAEDLTNILELPKEDRSQNTAALSYRSRMKASNGQKCGNEVYTIVFPDNRPENPPLFGDRYNFFLEGVVDCPEFLVHPPTLLK